jgi:D-tyrosyl-tRNA(Tyr) deacylase
MKIVIQRVSWASVTIDNKVFSKISNGLLILIGITNDDTNDDVDYLLNKVINMRVFPDENGKMNESLKDNSFEVLSVSQFTLLANTKKGNRPSFINAGSPESACKMFDLWCSKLKEAGVKSEQGVFGAEMKINLLNDGPVTIIIDSKRKE